MTDGGKIHQDTSIINTIKNDRTTKVNYTISNTGISSIISPNGEIK